MRKRLPTVESQILVRQLPLLIVLFVIVLYWLGKDLEGRLVSANLENARRASIGVVYAVEASMLADKNHEVWDEVVERIPRHGQTEIEIVDARGEVVFSTNPARRGVTQHISDPLCVRCHLEGSTQAVLEAKFVPDPEDEDYQVYVSPLRNDESCKVCHSEAGQKLGMVLVRQSQQPVFQQVRTLQLRLFLVGVVALVLTMGTTRLLLGRYLNRPLRKLVGGAKAIGGGDLQRDIVLPVDNELTVLADTLNASRKRLANSIRQLEQQRDDFRTLYRLVDQLSRSVVPEERRRRAVELAGKILNTDCALIRRSPPGAEASSGDLITLRVEGEVVEHTLAEAVRMGELPFFYSEGIVDRWQRGALADETVMREGRTVAYPLQRSGQDFGLLLRAAMTYDDHPTLEPAPDPEMVQALCKHLSIALEFSDLQRELVEEERLAAIGETVAGLAHWLKNTLNGLRAGQYVIDRAVDHEDQEKLRKGWDVMKKSVRQVERLTADVLYCAKERVPEREPTDLNQIIDEVLEVLSQKALDQGVELVAERGTETGEAQLDRNAIHRALLNLVSNAIDACVESEARGVVTVSNQVLAGDLLLTVADNGIGMSEAVRNNLFKRFFSTKGSKGTGLGLMVVQKIVEEHGGTLGVESVRGQGSSFQIRLPYAPA